MADRERVGFLGLGIMGWPMAANLVAAGFEVSAWNRTGERAERFAAEHGAMAAATPSEAAAGAQLVISMVVDSEQVELVLLGERGAAEGLAAGGVVIDMSTIAPSASVRIGERLRARGIAFLDAPVTGSRPKAEAGTLTIMAGGEQTAFARALPVLRALGELVVHVGAPGHGSMIKLINNTLAATNAAAVAEGLVLARAAGLDTDALRQVVSAGSGGSAVFDLKAGPMLDGDFEPLFKLEHMLKDVRYLIDEAGRLGCDVAMAHVAEQRYAEAARAGLGERDFAAVIETVEATPREKKT